MHKVKMITVAYAMPKENFFDIIRDLDKMFKGNDEITKDEQGSPTDYEGHAITYKAGKETIFFAIVLNSSRNRYLVRADEGLIEAEYNDS